VLIARKKGGCEKKLWAGGDRCLSTVCGGGGWYGAAPRDRSWGGDPMQDGSGSRPARAQTLTDPKMISLNYKNLK
jgi:hypothetical protein